MTRPNYFYVFVADFCVGVVGNVQRVPAQDKARTARPRSLFFVLNFFLKTLWTTIHWNWRSNLLIMNMLLSDYWLIIDTTRVSHDPGSLNSTPILCGSLIHPSEIVILPYREWTIVLHVEAHFLPVGSVVLHHELVSDFEGLVVSWMARCRCEIQRLRPMHWGFGVASVVHVEYLIRC